MSAVPTQGAMRRRGPAAQAAHRLRPRVGRRAMMQVATLRETRRGFGSPWPTMRANQRPTMRALRARIHVVAKSPPKLPTSTPRVNSSPLAGVIADHRRPFSRPSSVCRPTTALDRGGDGPARRGRALGARAYSLLADGGTSRPACAAALLTRGSLHHNGAHDFLALQKVSGSARIQMCCAGINVHVVVADLAHRFGHSEWC